MSGRVLMKLDDCVVDKAMDYFNNLISKSSMALKGSKLNE